MGGDKFSALFLSAALITAPAQAEDTPNTPFEPKSMAHLSGGRMALTGAIESLDLKFKSAVGALSGVWVGVSHKLGDFQAIGSVNGLGTGWVSAREQGSRFSIEAKGADLLEDGLIVYPSLICKTQPSQRCEIGLGGRYTTKF